MNMSTKHLILSITIILASMPLYAQNKDWAGFGKYSDANSNVTVKPKAVLFGDSITEDGFARIRISLPKTISSAAESAARQLHRFW